MTTEEEPFWREWSPEHAKKIDKALAKLVHEINDMVISGGETLYAEVIEWCVEQLRDELRAQIDADLKFDFPHDD